MIDLGGAFRWCRDHWLECLVGGAGIAAAGVAAWSLWRAFTAPHIPRDGGTDGISIVIPTLNEEKALPLVLESIARQKCSRPVEVLVVDGGRKGPSTDGTRDVACAIAVKHDLDLTVIIASALPGQARNIGAAHAKHLHLLFLDADSELIQEDFLEKMVDESNAKKVMIGTFLQRPRTGNPDLLLQAWYGAANAAYRYLSMSQAANLYARQEFFMWLGGFKEDRGLAEDLDFCQRAFRAGFTVHLFEMYVIWDERRLRAEGPLSLAKKYVDTWFLYAGEQAGLGMTTDDADPNYFNQEARKHGET